MPWSAHHIAHSDMRRRTLTPLILAHRHGTTARDFTRHLRTTSLRWSRINSRAVSLIWCSIVKTQECSICKPVRKLRWRTGWMHPYVMSMHPSVFRHGTWSTYLFCTPHPILNDPRCDEFLYKFRLINALSCLAYLSSLELIGGQMVYFIHVIQCLKYHL